MYDISPTFCEPPKILFLLTKSSNQSQLGIKGNSNEKSCVFVYSLAALPGAEISLYSSVVRKSA